MEKEMLAKHKKRILNKAADIMRDREARYFSVKDVMANFKRIGSYRDQYPQEVMMNLVSKQIVSLSDQVNHDFRDGNITHDPIPIEAYEENFVDILNYLFKLYAMVKEDAR